MRLLFKFSLLAAIAYSAWWGWENHSLLQTYFNNGEIITLEARFTPEQLMNQHRHELLADSKHTFRQPALKFYPYALIEAKYTGDDRRSREGMILWSLVDGEMVLNTDTWDTTHGFQDALMVGASRNDFRIMNAIAGRGGSTNKEQLTKDLRQDYKTIQPWVESARQKHLIVQKGAELQLHFQNPNILVEPATKINHWLVKKQYSHAQRIPPQFSIKQIEKISKAAFGTDFTIREIKEVALPIYLIEVLNPDGSVHTSYWNALNGKRLSLKSLTYKN